MLTTHTAQDPREAYRAALRGLKESRPDAFQRAIRHYEDVLVPAVADEAGEPLQEWLRFGLLLAESLGAGSVYRIDATGRAQATTAAEILSQGGAAPAVPSDLLLFLPGEPGTAALSLLTPREPTPPQRATIELLIDRRLG
ncbi:MAG: hypothetical protein ACRELD_02760 [Longimicrobiales bacterium]